MWNQLPKLASVFQPRILSTVLQSATRNFSLFAKPPLTINAPKAIAPPAPSSILQPAGIFFNIQRGMKVFGRVRRRCKDCYLVVRQGRLYNMCKTHPRHKQAAKVQKEKYTWIITDATQSKRRAW